METVLRDIKAVPGVYGAFVCSRDGRLLAHSFPPAFQEAALVRAARALADGALGLTRAAGQARLIDLRYDRGRVLARLVNGAALLLFCAPDTNLHLLEILTSVAAPKLETMVAEARPAPAPAPSPAPTPAPARGGAPTPPVLQPAVPHAAPRGALLALVQRIDAAIARRQVDRFEARGEIALRAGFSLGIVDAETPDDPDKLARLAAAARAVLGEPL